MVLGKLVSVLKLLAAARLELSMLLTVSYRRVCRRQILVTTNCSLNPTDPGLMLDDAGAPSPHPQLEQVVIIATDLTKDCMILSKKPRRLNFYLECNHYRTGTKFVRSPECSVGNYQCLSEVFQFDYFRSPVAGNL